ncbi:phage holin family protein [Amycolatopsis magusensis]|uniref:Flp pilus assembly protein TadB n=1 Tax=Amycolatopsis magusensis TaxID=882444 RepID=A0ABS4Q084_9PSEU|nr:phage holin family protein [Amycolatopsis magusensis]MBP2185069.1 Flp pilus assembly protein TadB [Amycolatopsis magusensis]
MTQDDRSVSQLVGDASEQLSRLVRDEMRLATAELQQKGKRLGTGAGLAGAAGFIAVVAVLVLVAAAVLGLAVVLPGWAAALIVAGALLVVAGIAALAGRSQLKRGTPPVPEEAVASVQADVKVLKESVHS